MGNMSIRTFFKDILQYNLSSNSLRNEENWKKNISTILFISKFRVVAEWGERIFPPSTEIAQSTNRIKRSLLNWYAWNLKLTYILQFYRSWRNTNLNFVCGLRLLRSKVRGSLRNGIDIRLEYLIISFCYTCIIYRTSAPLSICLFLRNINVPTRHNNEIRTCWT